MLYMWYKTKMKSDSVLSVMTVSEIASATIFILKYRHQIARFAFAMTMVRVRLLLNGSSGEMTFKRKTSKRHPISFETNYV